MRDGLDVVTIGVQDEGAVVVVVVLVAKSRLAIVPAACLEGSLIKMVDDFAGARYEGHMRWHDLRLDLEPKVGLAMRAEPASSRKVHDDLVVERRERLLVEKL